MNEERITRLRCRPGDLAIVTKCGVPERIGMIVRVVAPAGDGKHDWLTKLQGDGIHAKDVHTGRFRMCVEALVLDCNLTPIRGLSRPSQTVRGDRLGEKA
ncbi:hypothetical protein FEP54_00625 [Burkholderia multivorans]|nr:hypothetical protein [Burkholderia multivorans]MDR8921928.1 hypothetical protein [Burkholderia multivorans]MDR8965941.1 hypothetical protein [Burkholderia multivorans]MDR8993510.1 hypothetical protein [Burkholderia multivorans]MDR9019584.1 hypothetical protein [Burkholderia multivorans]